MSDYDFKTLNDKEFEIFCADVLGDDLGVRFERFKPGRDFGVDGRYFKSNGSEVILQCKHWANTPVSQLISSLSSIELPKLNSLKPAQYILAVSNPLSRTDKTAICKALAPHVKSEADIFGKEDLNDLIKSKPEIERRHYKLWLCSVNVLSHMLNKPIFDRSEFSIEEIIESAKKYVHTGNHNVAIEKLERLGVVIVTGEPGIGKTTLAEHLCLHYVVNGFQFFKISDEVREVEEIFERDERQVFYFDDFLGSNYLEALTGHEGSQIVQFIKRVVKNKKKRFVLTSRSTILNQGKVLIDKFEHGNIKQNEFEITMSSLSEMDRAQILYNHIWHSNLAHEYIDELYKDKRYKSIVRHRNYNPRLISFLTDAARLGGCAADGYWKYVMSMLNNPTDVWDNPFVAQQDDFGRAIVLLVSLNGRQSDQNELAEAYSAFASWPQNASMKGRKDFTMNLRHLTGSLISRKFLSSTDAVLELFNPSIGDYVLRRYAADLPTLKLGFLSLRTISSLNTLRDLHTNKIVGTPAFVQILAAVLEEAVRQRFVGYRPAYVAEASIALIESKIEIGRYLEALKLVIAFSISEPIPLYFHRIAELYLWALQKDEIADVTEEFAVDFISKACEVGLEENDIEVLGKIASQLDTQTEGYEDATSTLKAKALQVIEENLDGEINGSDIFAEVGYRDYTSAEDAAYSYVEGRLNELYLDFDRNDVNNLLDAVDVRGALDSYYESDDDRSDYRPSVAVSSIDEIDDLFDRS